MSATYTRLSSAQKKDILNEVVACQLCHFRLADSIDHNHRTGLIRGALCSFCNTALGVVERLTDSAIRQMREYLLTPPLANRGLIRENASFENARETRLRESVCRVLRHHPGISLTAALSCVTGRSKEVQSMLRGLVTAGVVEDRGGGKRHAYFLAAA